MALCHVRNNKLYMVIHDSFSGSELGSSSDIDDEDTGFQTSLVACINSYS